MKIHDESKALKCDVCFKLFSTKHQLTSHFRTHTGEKPFACQFCSKRFAHKKQLRHHHQAVHCGLQLPIEELARKRTFDIAFFRHFDIAHGVWL